MFVTVLNAEDDRTSCQEEQCFEESVRHQVEHAGHGAPMPTAATIKPSWLMVE
jgi:hypothetical protein